MGWTVLYIAFGFVALWLLGEVLLQYKARLRWRLLAFVGFLGVVLGVLMSQVIVIGLGAIAFAVGQTYVTLSFRRGFEQGWAVNPPAALGGLTGGKKSRRERGSEDPALAVSDLEQGEAAYGDELGYDQGRPATAGYGHDDEYDRDDVFTPARSAAETTAVYEPQPLPDDTGSYGVYNDSAYAGDQSYAGADQTQDQYATAAADQTYGYDGYTGYDQQQYGYDQAGQQQYAAYSDPYIGTQTYGTGSYDTSYGGQQQFAQQGYDQYGGTYGGETPAGGVWVPQQRTDESYGGELPPEQGYYPDNGQGQQNQGQGYDEQYRF
ncbi:SCO2102 family sporulation regulator [Streptomyces pseudovenezuelae]|uniref:Uncharacterized protein n=1 Tax=Streptomyces pseudovenezuelae TaxID=67350 RepID=A0ABZ1WTI7_9ACTN|nr:hypothetical protein [Streptomyces pseudovenezuelae]WUA91560.1 hypothetical protein OHO81_31540 [Streptomyces pseudovenezuelae]